MWLPAATGGAAGAAEAAGCQVLEAEGLLVVVEELEPDQFCHVLDEEEEELLVVVVLEADLDHSFRVEDEASGVL